MLVYYNCIDKSTHKIEWTNKYRFWSLCHNLLQYEFYLGFMVVENYFIDMFYFMQTKYMPFGTESNYSHPMSPWCLTWVIVALMYGGHKIYYVMWANGKEVVRFINFT